MESTTKEPWVRGPKAERRRRASTIIQETPRRRLLEGALSKMPIMHDWTLHVPEDWLRHGVSSEHVLLTHEFPSVGLRLIPAAAAPAGVDHGHGLLLGLHGACLLAASGRRVVSASPLSASNMWLGV